MEPKVNTINGEYSIKHLENRLNEPITAQAVDRLLNRIGTLEKAVENLTTLMEQGPGLMAMTADMVDEGYRQAQSNGVSIENRLGAALNIAEKLTTPAIVEKLDSLLTVAEQAPGLIAMVTDMVDEGYQNASKNGVGLEERLQAVLQISEKLTEPAMMKKLETTLDSVSDSPALDASTMELINKITTSFGEVKSIEKPGGIFGLMRALKDPDRQNALGFLLEFAKRFGQKM